MKTKKILSVADILLRMLKEFQDNGTISGTIEEFRKVDLELFYNHDVYEKTKEKKDLRKIHNLIKTKLPKKVLTL